MSSPSHAPKIASPPASVRSNAPQAPGHAPHAAHAAHAAHTPYPLDAPEVTPKSLTTTGRSKTAPLALEHLWTSSVDRPPLSERDSIFATTYTHESPTASPQLASDEIGTYDNVSDDGLYGMAASASSPKRLIDAPVLRRPSLSHSPSTLKDHQSLLATHFKSKHSITEMGPGLERPSPPPFMSPVDSPIQRPSSPQTPDAQSSARSLLDTLTESEERLKYRSWREGNAEFPHSNGASQRNRDVTHMDKKIEATLPQTEQPAAARSRKASHYLRVFKENDAAEDQKRREGRARERRPPEQTEVVSKSISRPGSTAQTPQVGPTGSYFESTSILESEASKPGIESMLVPATPVGEKEQPRTLPLRLLEEIRNLGNLTPGADRGSSFSKSLPTAAAERLVNAKPTSEVYETSSYFQITQDEGQQRSSGSEDDEESEKEQISSALYFPHRQLQSPKPMEKKDDIHKAEIEKATQRRKSFNTGKGTQGWAAEEAVKTPPEVEISLQSQDTNQCLHGDISTTASAPKDETALLSPPDTTTSADSEAESLTESSHSLFDEDSSATDDLGTTPTATSHKSVAKQTSSQPPAPLGAVELKPYDHQVGGHSTVYRFSRRAVCKQLNNRENEFYETVEKHHPELLEFLPRYDFFFTLSMVALKLKHQPRHFTLPWYPRVFEIAYADVMLSI